jgi:hypothetical protein
MMMIATREGDVMDTIQPAKSPRVKRALVNNLWANGG